MLPRRRPPHIKTAPSSAGCKASLKGSLLLLAPDSSFHRFSLPPSRPLLPARSPLEHGGGGTTGRSDGRLAATARQPEPAHPLHGRPQGQDHGRGAWAGQTGHLQRAVCAQASLWGGRAAAGAAGPRQAESLPAGALPRNWNLTHSQPWLTRPAGPPHSPPSYKWCAQGRPPGLPYMADVPGACCGTRCAAQQAPPGPPCPVRCWLHSVGHDQAVLHL